MRTAPALDPGHAHHDVDAELDSGLHRVFERPRRLLGIDPLADLVQGHGIARLQPGVDALDAGRRDPSPLVLALLDQKLGRPVHGDPFEVRPPLDGGLANLHQLAGGQSGAVAVGQENGPHVVAVRFFGHVEILDDLLDRPRPEGLFLIHGAERAPVVRTADGGLDDQRTSFARRTENLTLVSHRSQGTVMGSGGQVAPQREGVSGQGMREIQCKRIEG